jgi:hypothetical protein
VTGHLLATGSAVERGEPLCRVQPAQRRGHLRGGAMNGSPQRWQSFSLALSAVQRFAATRWAFARCQRRLASRWQAAHQELRPSREEGLRRNSEGSFVSPQCRQVFIRSLARLCVSRFSFAVLRGVGVALPV